MNNKKSIELLSLLILLIITNVLSIYILFIKTQGSRESGSVIKKNNADNVVYKAIDYNYNSKKEYIDYTSDRFNQYYKKVVKDDKGIALTKIDGKYVYDIKSIDYYGLMLFGKYIETGNEEYYQQSKAQADYILNNQDITSGCFNNYYNVSLYDNEIIDNNKLSIESCCSGSSQALSISLLSRIYSIEKNDIYKNAVFLALNPIKKDMIDGGLKTNLFGYTFYDEYSKEKPIYSLDSMMYTTIALYDLDNVFKLEKAREMFYDCIKTIEFFISYYDNNGMSINNLAFIKDSNMNIEYSNQSHINHLYQLDVLNQINKSEIFNFYLLRWINYK